ncbi:MAG: hypothetical protein CMP40_02790 [Rickettsiales bacterium]|nr:hypothetical protein [Rickettsiales bacterium]|tara:strand:- start:1601 stop:2293 length:693 start_codon:yes stop_codon:yes gene_type:complete
MFFRSILFNIIFYISILFFGIAFLPLLISKKYTSSVVRLWANFILICLKKILNIQINFDNNYINENEGMIIAANHKSVFDTIYFLAEYKKVIYIVKKELKYLPIYGWYAIRMGNIFLDRKKRFESIKKLSNNIETMVKKGFKIVIFPEGSRQKKNRIGEIKPGIFLIQNNLKKPIYPVYINSADVWPKDTWKKYSNNILLKALKPIEYGLDKNKFKNKLKKVFERMDNGY